ncbi:MAG: TonB-dependent receptor [Prevotellaceae bacterium]|jgi:iron complex outermembrane receptor protein|nr:TonB-dependent receptor [Prevotellaceae bacterium]
MKKGFLFMAGSMLAPCLMQAQMPDDTVRVVNLEQIEVVAVRAGGQTPVAYSDVGREQIVRDNVGRSLPALLQGLPSVVAYFEDGLGVGYTSLRVRGTDATRIHVTLNGMPLNNPESQEVYWVNIPDLNSHLQSLQLQRGVGTSSNGAAAFGASLSLKTTGTPSVAYGEAATTWGSYHTQIHSVAAGSGALPGGFYAEARYASVGSDGYLRNGKVKQYSFQTSLTHRTEKHWLKLLYLRGVQHTGITWEGISPEDMARHGRRYNVAGQYADEAGNIRYYDNETDNYFSDIVQLLYARPLGRRLTLHANVSYNHGFGYYENYKANRKLQEDYGLPPQTIGGVVHSRSDVVIRKNMENDFYVAQGLLHYAHRRLSLNAGAMYSLYNGAHFGTLEWAQYNETIAPHYEWNRNDARKEEGSLFIKGEYALTSQLTAYADVQARLIIYNLSGLDDDLMSITDRNRFRFVNPKAGLYARLSRHTAVYASWAMAHREPLRADLKEAVKNGGAKDIRPEQMHDFEAGCTFQRRTLTASANAYYMRYKDQMVQTGKLNDVGYKLMENVPESYRAGLELQAAFTPSARWRLEGNATLSRNRILNYTVYYDLYDNAENYAPVVDASGRPLQEADFYASTDISFSPAAVAAAAVTFAPLAQWDITLTGKYVGKQYYDNTSNDAHSLPAYALCHLATQYVWQLPSGSRICVQLAVNNLFNHLYSANAWVATDRFLTGAPAVYRGLFPQAGTTIMGKVSLEL